MASETFNQMKERMQSYLTDENSAFYDAANRLLVKISGNSKEISEICYHYLCCSKFMYTPGTKLSEDDLKNRELQRATTESFLELFERKVIVDKEAYLLRDLMDDIKDISEENGLHELSIRQSCNLKKLLHQRFGNEIDFYSVGNRLIVHPSSISPVSYSVAILRQKQCHIIIRAGLASIVT